MKIMIVTNSKSQGAKGDEDCICHFVAINAEEKSGDYEEDVH